MQIDEGKSRCQFQLMISLLVWLQEVAYFHRSVEPTLQKVGQSKTSDGIGINDSRPHR